MSAGADVRAARDPDDELGRRILDAAVVGFGTVGVRRTTMEDVAEGAGISRATLYRRFGGRDEIVRATVQREMAGCLAAVERDLRGVRAPVDRFVDGFVGILQAVRANPLLVRLLQDEPDVLLPQLTLQASPIMTMCRDWLADELAVARQRGRVRGDVDPAIVAELLVRLSHSLLLTPDGHLQADDEVGLRVLARQHLAPAVFAHGPR